MSNFSKKFVNTLPRGGEEMCSPVESQGSYEVDSDSDRTITDVEDDPITVMGDRDLIPGFPSLDGESSLRLVVRKFINTSPYPILLLGMRQDRCSFSFFEVEGTRDIRGVHSLASELFGEYEYDGYYRDGSDVYAFVTCTSSFLGCDISVCWHVCSETVNQKHSFGIQFAPNVVDFFSRNPLFLHQQEGPIILPSPSVWYVPSDSGDLISLRFAGPHRDSVDSDSGPFYRLFSFDKASAMEPHCFLVKYAVFESNITCQDNDHPEWWRDGSQMISDSGDTITLVKTDDVHFIEYNEHYSSESSPAGAPSTSL